MAASSMKSTMLVSARDGFLPFSMHVFFLIRQWMSIQIIIWSE